MVAVTPTAPIDATHAESVHAVAVIRAEVARLRRGVAVWQLSRSDAGEYPTASAVGSTNNQPTKD